MQLVRCSQNEKSPIVAALARCTGKAFEKLSWMKGLTLYWADDDELGEDTVP